MKLKDFWNETSNRIGKIDVLFIFILIFCYSLLAFFQLGDTEMPQTYFKVSEENAYVIFELEEATTISKIRLFSGPEEGIFRFSTSLDGQNYNVLTTEEFEYSFTWNDISMKQNMRYLMIEGTEVGTSIGEIQLYDENEEKVNLIAATDLGTAMIDELNLVPEKISYRNSMYFDEIYFAKSAYQYANHENAYEWVHPPLGKLIQAIPIVLFGMSPFTCRMSGVISGILLILVIYVFAKELFGKRKYAILASLLMVFDNFHFAQSRMGTIDTHLTLFILTSFFFLFRYLKASEKAKLKTKLIYLCLSGIFIGCAIATKWIGLFGGLGLAILFFTHFIKNYVTKKEKYKEGIFILISCIFFYILIPFVIYFASYFFFPNLQTIQIHSIKDIVTQTKRMYQYHSSLTASHSFTSKWYTWSMMIKPVWYHVSYLTETTRETISGIGNPMIWWIGTVAMIYLLVSWIEKKTMSKFTLVIAILTLWFPYIFIGRVMFLYHFFPVLPFMMLAIVSMFKEITEKRNSDKWMIFYIILVIFFFVLFYPVSSGMEISNHYLDLIRWASTWNF